MLELPRSGPAPRIRPRTWLVVGLLSLCACGGGGGGWVDTHPDVADRARTEPASFRVAAGRQWDGVEALTASYGLRVSRGVGSRSFDVSVVVQRPDRLEISFLDPTGATEAFLMHGPGEIGLYFAEDQVLYRAASRPGAFERALGLELGPADVVAAFIGYAVVGGAGETGTPAATWDAEAARIRVRTERALGWLHPVTLLWDRVEYFGLVPDPGPSAAAATGRSLVEPTVVAEFGPWRMAPAPAADTAAGERLVDPPGGVRPGVEELPATVPIPARIEFDVADGSYGLTLEMRRDPTVDPEVPPDYFRVPPLPASVLTVPLQELEREGGLFRRATETGGEGEAGGRGPDRERP